MKKIPFFEVSYFAFINGICDEEFLSLIKSNVDIIDFSDYLNIFKKLVTIKKVAKEEKK